MFDAIESNAAQRKGDTAFEFIEDDGTLSSITFGELADSVFTMAAGLAQVAKPGARAVVLYPPGLDYIVSICAAMAAGAAAVPAYPPTSPRHLPRLRSLLESCRADVVLASEHFAELVDQLGTGSAGQPASAVPWVLGTEASTATSAPPAVHPDDVALIQYTSGSTSAPRGVVLTHRAILSNLAMIQDAVGMTPDDVAAMWLPPYHDMGLIGGILTPLYVGYRSRLMSPLAFIRDPLAWLSHISDVRATIAGGPNFAFDRCSRRIARERLRLLDLGCWRVAFTGSEPVRATSLSRFAAAFAPYGFREEAFYPCYGLAEATLMATGARRGQGAVVRAFSRTGLSERQVREPVTPRDRRKLVSSGRPVPGLSVRIADETGRSLPARSIGEIRLAGPNIASGYVAETPGSAGTAFVQHGGERELATRDLGFLDADGELFVCGRASDLIILRGRNVHPEDVELVVEEALAQPGPAIAFGVDGDGDGDERLVVLREARGVDADGIAAATARIRSRVGEVLGLQPAAVLLVEAGDLPRTSSGKVQRSAARRQYLEGRFVHRREVVLDPDPPATGDALTVLRRSVARVLDLPLTAVVASEPPTALGLDSMGAVEVSEEVEDRHGLVISPADLVAGASLLDVAEQAAPAPPGRGDDDRTGDEASFGEQAMWLHERLGDGPSPYVLPVAVELGADVDRGALDAALADVVARCPALRSWWSVDDGVLRRRVAPQLALELHLERHDAADDISLRAVLATLSRHRLDPTKPGGALRATLLELGEQRRILHLAVHHLAADHRALGLLLGDLGQCYAARLTGRGPPPAGTTGVAGVAAAERELLASPEGDRLLAAWVDRLRGAPAPPRLPMARPRARPLRFDAVCAPVPMQPATAEMLRLLARSEGTTPFVVLAAAVHALLARLTGERDVVIGAASSRRGIRSRRNTVGLVMNVLPLRVDVDRQRSFRELVGAEHVAVVAARAGEDVPLVRIVEALHLGGESSPLYNTTLTMMEHPTGHDVAGNRWRVVDIAQPGVASDLAVDVRTWGDAMAIELRSARQVLDERETKRLAGRLSRLLEHAVAVPDQPVAAIPLADVEERHHLLALGASATSTPPSDDVFSRFAQHADQTPDAAALRTPTGAVTYAVLHRRACALAADLRDAGEPLVLVRLPRGPSLVTTMLAALAAGVPWVPVDPEAPAARLERIVADVDAGLLVSDDPAPPVGRELRVIPAVSPRRDGLDPRPTPERSLAYLMYTSGSSGRPKGVMVERRSLSALLDAVATLGPVASRRRFLATTNVGFDISLLELLMPLVIGGTVVAGPDGVRSPDGLRDLIESEDVDLVQGTPSTFAVLLDAGLRFDRITVLCGGEAAPPGLFRRIRDAGADAVVNVYGPTETTVWSTAHVTRGDRDPPLGRPLPGESVYVLDERSELVPLDVEGEICIGGVGVGRGYLGQPALTAERFVPDPFSATPGARMYRTGDVARYDGEDELRFAGRHDRQVKVRGVRVECAEVELALHEHQAIRRAAVVAMDESAGPALVGVVQWRRGRRASVDDLRAFLSERLPPQAVPSLFREVEEIPVTERGKLDVPALRRAALLEDGRSTEPPITPSEVALAEIWRSLLDVDPVGRFDHFFMLGGHSLLALGVVARVAERLGRRIGVADVMQAPTLDQLARRVDAAERIEASEVAAAPAPAVLSDAQRRLWVAENLEPGAPSASITLAVRIEGPLDVGALRDALDGVLERHAELRAIFPSEAGRPVRRIAPHRPVDLRAVAVPADDGLSRLHDEIVRGFDVERGPLVRLTLLRTSATEHLLALTAHHLVADVTAAAVLVREVSQLYDAAVQGTGPPALAEPADFAEVVARLSAYAGSPRRAADLAWWRELLAAAPRRSFPAPSPGPGAAGGGVEAAVIEEASATAVRRYAQRRGATPFVVAAAVLARVVAQHTHQPEVVLGVDVSGRDEPGAADAVGPLVNQLCLRIDTTAPTLADLVDRTRARVSDALAHSRASYDRVVAAVVVPDASDRALFDVKLAYQPAVEDLLDLGGLQVTTVPRAPVPPAEALVLFVRERPHEFVVELQHRTDVIDGPTARALLGAFVDTLDALVTGRDPVERSPWSPSAAFTRRTARTVEVPPPDGVGEPDTSDPSGPPVIRAGPGTDLRRWVTGNRQQLDDLLVAHGALLFRGFGVDEPGTLRQVIDGLGDPPYHSTEHDRVALAADVYTPIPYSHHERLLWHNEDTFRPGWPGRLWFACARPAEEGGETTIADSRAVLGALGEIGSRLASEGVMYVRRFGDGLGQSWQAVFGTSDRQQVEARCRAEGIVTSWDGDRLATRTVRPATTRHPSTGEVCWIAQLLHFHPAALSEEARSSLVALYGENGLPRDCRYADGTPIPDVAVSALMAAYESVERVCRWQSGDVLVMDNLLMAHGRRPYAGDRRLFVAMTGSLQR